MDTQRVILTYQDYEVLPADGRRYEIHEGELSVTPASSPQHQRTLRNLNAIIWPHVKMRELGEVFFAPIDCILSETTVVQPDLVFLDTNRLHFISARGIEGPPTLVVEILSPATTSMDRSTKRQLYARYGVPYYWIIDPVARTIEVHRLSEPGYQLLQRAIGDELISLSPFSDLVFSLASLWE